MNESTVLVTGGAGFIGSALIRFLLESTEVNIVNVDKLTYAGSLSTLDKWAEHERHQFYEHDINDRSAIEQLLNKYRPGYIMHLAAESHVDRSIDGPSDFINTNIVGTYTMLESTRQYYDQLDDQEKSKFRFHHISTDEVYGSLKADGLFTESTPYKPNSPYSASKASSDHLVRAWHKTYGLPVVITNCSNNYGPYQFPEKLIPLTIKKAIAGEPIPIYGKGDNIRDWLFVNDHVEALWEIVTRGVLGEVYNVGGHNEMTNIEVVKTICRLLDEMQANSNNQPYADQIHFVEDRPGHDQRYAIDASKLSTELGWTPRETFESGISKTVRWYLDNQAWVNDISEDYSGSRLGHVKGKGQSS